MDKRLLAGYCIALGCLWLIVVARADPQIVLGLVACVLLLRVFDRKRGANDE